MFIICSTCPEGLRVVGEPDEIKSLISSREGCVCYVCGAECMVSPFADNDVLQTKHVHTLSPMEAYLALEGMGIPEERECASEIVATLLIHQRIKKVTARSVPNTGRSCIDAIEFEDGTVMYLASSVHGALVYRIKKPHNYTEVALGEP